MSVVRTDKSNHEAELAINITKDDYQPKLQEELKKYQQKAQMKGFRKGKIPVGVIRKMYGKAMLADIVNAMIEEKLRGYLESEKLDILGQPMPSNDQQIYSFNLDQPEDFTFLFDIGLTPQFEVAGIDGDTVFKQPKVEVTTEMIDKELDALRARFGDEIQQDSDFQDNDRLVLNAIELEDGKLKEDGLETSFQILISNIADETLREQVKAMKKGDVFQFDIFKLEPDRSEDYVRKYLLNLEKDEMDKKVGHLFEATISEVIRIVPAELNEEFFTKAFDEGQVMNEDEARNKLKEQIESFYNRQTEALLYKDFQTKLLELNSIELPDAFLKRWIVASNEKVGEAQLMHDYPDFSRNLIWSLIEKKIQERFDLQVGIDEVKEVLRAQIRRYFRNYPVSDEILESSVMRMIEDKEQVSRAYEESMSDKVFETIRANVAIQDDLISLENFKELVKEAEQSRNQHHHNHDHDHDHGEEE